jgi:CIC family chloride channel protein
VIENVIAWKERHLTDKQMTSILAFVIGILASVAAYILHTLITLVQRLLPEDF